MAEPIKILFVCMGNICRSPTAEGVMKKLVAESVLADRVDIDSAGTHGYHIGSSPDARSVEHAARRGIDLTTLRARQISAKDFSRFHHVLVMDQLNMRHVGEVCPLRYADRVKFLLSFAGKGEGIEVPDPYDGEGADFERVLDLVEEGCQGLLQYLIATHHSRKINP
jgi:protein-tyrosine phosphatase